MEGARCEAPSSSVAKSPSRRDQITALGNGGGNLPSRKPLKTQETRRFSQRARRLSCEAGRTRPAVPVAHVAPSPPKSRGRDRGGNFSCCKALKNLKTRKFFAVIAERPVFRMSRGTRAVGYRLQRRLAPRLRCVYNSE